MLFCCLLSVVCCLLSAVCCCCCCCCCCCLLRAAVTFLASLPPTVAVYTAVCLTDTKWVALVVSTGGADAATAAAAASSGGLRPLTASLSRSIPATVFSGGGVGAVGATTATAASTTITTAGAKRKKRPNNASLPLVERRARALRAWRWALHLALPIAALRAATYRDQMLAYQKAVLKQVMMFVARLTLTACNPLQTHVTVANMTVVCHLLCCRGSHSASGAKAALRCPQSGVGVSVSWGAATATSTVSQAAAATAGALPWQLAGKTVAARATASLAQRLRLAHVLARPRWGKSRPAAP